MSMTTELPSRKRLERYIASGIRHGYSPSDLQALAAFALAAMDIEPIYQCEFCHHDANGELQWHWEDVNKGFYDQYDSGRRGKRRVLYPAPLQNWLISEASKA
jgi:hypothetical protein